MARYENERGLKVTAVSPEELVLCEVRGFGYGAVHLARVPAGHLLMLGGTRSVSALAAHGLASPVVALCGCRVRSAQPFVKVEHVWAGSVLAFGDDGECAYCTRAVQSFSVAMDELFR